MKRRILSVTACLSLLLPSLSLAQTTTLDADIDSDTSTSIDMDAEVAIGETESRQRVVHTFTTVQESVDVDDLTTLTDELFDIQEYIAHPCFAISSDAEEVYCRRLFGSHFNLGATLDTGMLSTLLTSTIRLEQDEDEDAIVDIIGDTLSAAAEDVEMMDAEDEDAEEEEVTPTQSRSERSNRVWEECATQTSVAALRRSCFQDNLRLVTDDSVSLDQQVNFSAAWRDDTML